MADICEIDAHVSKRYEVKKRLGKGAYGIVWKAVDKKTGLVVAVKKIFDAFRNQTDAQRTYREIMFLQHFGDHPNVIRLLEVHKADNHKDIYLVFEYMETDLHNVIKRGNILKDIHKRYIMYQLLKATKYLHSGNVIHRDQKPSNILLDGDCHCKVADFGLARSLAQGSEDGQCDPSMTDYVATRWYRAPEILLASKRYTKGIDMWSLGCILGEMLLSQPLFPGTSTLNQLEKIMSAIPSPDHKDIVSLCSGYASTLLEKSLQATRKPLRDMLAGAPDDAIDLMEKLLVLNPYKRLTAEQALQHPYVAKFHQPDKETALSYDVIPTLSDDIQLTVDEYRNKLYELVAQQKRQQFQRHSALFRRAEHETLKKASLSSQSSHEETVKGEESAPTKLSELKPRELVPRRKSSLTQNSPDDRQQKSPEEPHNQQQTRHALSRSSSPLLRETRKSGSPVKNRSSLGRISQNLATDSTTTILHSHVSPSSRKYSVKSSTAKGIRPQHSYPGTESFEVEDSKLANLLSTTFSRSLDNPVLTRDTSKYVTEQRDSKVSKEKAKPLYGKKQFSHVNNVSRVQAYPGVRTHSQSHGTISASALLELRSGIK